MNYNRCVFGGRLVRDVELRYTANNQAVANFGIAINRSWSKDGEKQEEVTFIDLEAWAKTAEVINQYFKKSDPIFVECRARLNSWNDKDGNQRSKIVFVVESFQFIKSKGDGEGDPSQPPRQQRAPAASASQGRIDPRDQGANADEDIPF